MATVTPRWNQSSPVRCANKVVPHSEHDVPLILQSDFDMFVAQCDSRAQSGDVHGLWAEYV